MLKLFTGSARSELSHKCVCDMVSQAIKMPETKFFIIVPEQFTLQTQKRVVSLHPRHACMNIDVVSFDRLAHVVLAKQGKDINEVLDDVGKALILRNILDSTASELVVYGSKVRMPGFINELQSLITELKQYRIDDNALYLMQQDACERQSLLASKLQDIRLIYRKFNESIADRYTTAEEILEVFSRLLPESDFMAGSEVFLDGFTGFTPIQYRIIEQMLTITSNVTCTVTIPESAIKDKWEDYELFALANDTIARLKNHAANVNQKVCETHAADEVSVPFAVNVVGCPGPVQEVEFVTGKILDLVRNKGKRYRDIAVLASDLESYHKLIETSFKNAGISAFMDCKNDFGDNPLVRFILAALDISQKGMLYEPMFNFMKTGLVGLDKDETCLLENYCLEFNVRGRNRWTSEFTMNRELTPGVYAWNLDRINEIRKKVADIVGMYYGRTGGKNKLAALYCKHLKNLLESFNVSEQIEQIRDRYTEEGRLDEARLYDQIYDKITELLEKINLIMGHDVLSVKEFADIVQSGINEIKIGIIPPSVDALIAGDLNRTRLDKVSHVFVLGVNDGKIPSAGSGSILLTQKEREFLRKDYEIAPTVKENIYEQKYYLYLAFNKPENELYLTYSSGSAAGEQLTPSCVIEDIQNYIQGAAELNSFSFNKKADELWKVRAKEELAGEVRNLARSKAASESVSPVFEYFAAEDPDAIRRLAAAALFSNKQNQLDSVVAERLYGNVLAGSVSRYENFYQCPFRQFINYGLRLEPRREYQIQTTDLGTIYHGALEKYSKRLGEEGLTFRTVDDERSHQIISECVDAAVEEIETDVLNSSARNEHLIERIREITGKTTDVLREQVRAGLFEPAEYEYGFETDISDNVRFKGKIDRIDIYDAGDIFVKIIDYKSGSKKFNIRDIYSGLQLQLVAYMKSAIDKMEEQYPGRNVRPGGVYYYLINDKYTGNEDDEAKKNQMSGLTLCEENVVNAIDLGLGSGEYKKSKIIPVSYNNSGIDSRSQIANASEFNNLIQFVDDKITSAGEKIRSGDVSVSPDKGDSSHNGCTFCEFADICKFEAGSFGTDWNECTEDKNVMEDKVYGRN